jgi:hypothetical protein
MAVSIQTFLSSSLPPGPQGIQGVQGTYGSGSQGTQGIQGVQGLGIQGAQGVQGVAGASSSPGGSTTQLQYNNGGAFAGTSGITTTGTELGIASGTKTASAPILDLSQTWNNAAVTFTGLKLNIANTASGAGSLLANFQVDGTSLFGVSKSGGIGYIQQPGGQLNGMLCPTTTGSVQFYQQGGFMGGFQAYRGLLISSNQGAGLGFTDGVSTTAGDTYLHRDAANTVAQRNSTAPQEFRLYNTYSDSSNYERGFLKWDAGVLRLGFEKLGSGTNRSLEIGDPAGGYTTSLFLGAYAAQINSSFGITLQTSNSTRPVRVAGSSGFYVGTTSGVTTPSGTIITEGSITSSGAISANNGTISASAPVLNLSQTWNNASETFTAVKVNVANTAYSSTSSIMDLQLNGDSKFKIITASSGRAYFDGNQLNLLHATSDSFKSVIRHSGNESLYFTAYGSNVLYLSGSDFTPAVQIPSNKSFGWSSSTSQTQGDLVLHRDDAGVFAQRNSTNAQTFRLYNTYTDASNYERGKIAWSSNVLEVGAEAAGTGANNILRFTSAVAGAGTAWEFRSGTSNAPRLVLAGSDRSVTISPQVNMLAAVGGGFWSILNYSAGPINTIAFRSTNGNQTTSYFGLAGSAASVMQLNTGAGAGSGYGASMEFFEMTAPSAPSANGARIYVEDDGAGKTRLMVLFATGVAQQIAIEP